MIWNPDANTVRARRGVILLVVVAMLTLFAIVGLSFVLYAESAARSAQTAREVHQPTTPELDTEGTLAFFLNQLIFDADDKDGIFSALRGHSLARSMYGFNYVALTPSPLIDPTGTQHVILQGDNTTPFNGTGRLKMAGPPIPNPSGPSIVTENYDLVNYMFYGQFRVGTSGPLSDGFLRDPERMGFRTGINPRQASPISSAFGGAANVPYTYPDLNNMFLAVVGSRVIGPTTVENVVLTPSFHRPWLFGRLADIPGVPAGNPGNPNWTNPQGKYLILRPRPNENPGFPYPEDDGGDVKNLVNSPGLFNPFTGQIVNNDSIWIDLGHPVMTAPDGRKYKPLFAPLVLDLDNRVNVNVHGNIRARVGSPPQVSHASNEGWGPWEVNLGRVLNNTNAPSEWTNLFSPDPLNLQPNPIANGLGQFGRYGADQFPGTQGSSFAWGWNAPPTPTIPFYAPLDFDGCNEQMGFQISTQFQLPGATPRSCFPPVNTNTQNGYGNVSATEVLNHPSLNGYFQRAGGDRHFGLSNVEALLRFGDGLSPALTSDLFRLCRANLGGDTIEAPSNATRRRRLLTTHSFDVDRPGLIPWVRQDAVSPYTLQADPSSRPLVFAPRGGGYAFPTPGTPAPTPGAEFGTDWRAVNIPTLPRLFDKLDLNRPLPDYPTPDAGTQLIPTTNPKNLEFQIAQSARQQFAADIFIRLRAITGADDNDALRWLAQLAVNIVDFIDQDDYITPFNWNNPGYARPPFEPLLPSEAPPPVYTAEWVFGTELPRALINEVYVASPPPPAMSTARDFYVWAELYNPMHTSAPLRDSGAARLQQPGGGSAIYRLVLAKGAAGQVAANLRQRNNTIGNLTNPALQCEQTVAGAPAVLDAFPEMPLLGPSDGLDDNQGTPGRGYYVVRPDSGPAINGVTPDHSHPGMHYQTRPLDAVENPTVILQRLACPTRPLQSDATMPNFNPYVTVDFMDQVVVDVSVAQDGQTVGRAQPFQEAGKAPQTNPGNTPQHTIGRINSNAAATFTWLVHLDRLLKSPVDILHVSAFKPSELTQEFGRAAGGLGTFGHRAPWFDENAPAAESNRLYRLFEFVETRSLLQGLNARTTTITFNPAAPPGPGKIVRKPPTNPADPLSFEFFPVQMSGFSPSGGMWRIQANTILRVIPQGANLPDTVRPECVRVRKITPVSFEATFLSQPDMVASGTQFTIELTATGDRIPGKINLNTVWDVDALQALTDPQTSNSYNASDIQTLFATLMSARAGTATVKDPLNGNVIRGPSSPFSDLPGPTDGVRTPPQYSNPFPAPPMPPPLQVVCEFSQNRPYLGMSAGLTAAGDVQYPNGVGLADTFLRDNPTTPGQRLLQGPDSTHSTRQFELLSKVHNQLTTRSNVFAVWLTVGFFEVTDETTSPVRLGAEIGRNENRHIRHRMFTIIDRTNLLQQIVATPNRPTQLGNPPDPLRIPEDAATMGALPPSINLDTGAITTVAITAGLDQPFSPIDRNDPTFTTPLNRGTLNLQIGPQQLAFANTPDPGHRWQLNWAIQGRPPFGLPPPPGTVVPGTVVLIGPGADGTGADPADNWETVIVRDQQSLVGPQGTFVADFTRAHRSGAPIHVLFSPGNPGPQTRFDHRYNTAIVPYSSVIQ